VALDRLNPGHLILAALILAAAVLGWRAVTFATAPLPPTPAFAPPALADRGLLSRVDPFFPALNQAGEALPVTALPFSLHGVRADSATGRGSAILATGDGQQQVYAVGDTIADGVTLAAIAADHVVLDRSGTREALWIDSGSAASVQSFDPSQQSAMPGAGSGFAQPPPASQGAANNLADPADQAPPSGGGEVEAGQPETGQPDSGRGEPGRGEVVATTGRSGNE
jgi:general secretion pathway protein C